MIHEFPFYLVLIVSIILLIMLAKRIKVAYPIILVVAGLLVSFLPGIPHVEISPELIFIIFLPPLLYEAAWDTSWKELWLFRRIISSFAFLIVIMTAGVVAWVASSFIPGFTLALGFLLGGIVSPPDAVSASAIMQNVKVSKHFRAIVEGESLLNDAASLIVFRFALIAVDTGRFVFGEATMSFFWVIFAGIAIGLAVAYIFYLAHKWLPTDVNMDIVLTLVAPYAMYILAETLHVSGVLAVVSGGLFLAARSHIFLSNTSRLKAGSVWSALGFVLNGLVFLLIGLQLPAITADLGTNSMGEAIGYGVLITGILIVGRLLSAFGAAGFTRLVSPYISTASRHIRSRESTPGWRVGVVFGWTGMRGVVSLAAALSIPVLLSNGQPFPQRNLILFITFVVILLTLLIQGLTLPWLIKTLKITDPDIETQEENQNRDLHQRLATESLKYLQENFRTEIQSHVALQQLATRWENTHLMLENELLHDGYKKVYLQLLDQQRAWLREWNKDIEIEEELIRNHLMRIDLEEEKLRYS